MDLAEFKCRDFAVEESLKVDGSWGVETSICMAVNNESQAAMSSHLDSLFIHSSVGSTVLFTQQVTFSSAFDTKNR